MSIDCELFDLCAIALSLIENKIESLSNDVKLEQLEPVPPV